jgi:hypothetical protein
LESAADRWIPFLVDSRRYPSIFCVVRDRCGIKGVAEATTTFASVFDDSAALRASASKSWHKTGATCAQIRGAGRFSKGDDACDVFARIRSNRSLVWRRCGPEVLRDTVWSMETFEALRERVLDRFEALGAIELKGVADPVPLFRAASW